MKNRKIISKMAAVVLALALFLTVFPCSSAEAAPVKTNVFVYMIGSDLETKNAAATADIKEMIAAAENFKGDINLIVYAGGAKEWHNDIFSSEENRCVRIDRNGAELLYAEGTRDMTDPATLSAFLRRSCRDFPAERNILILWDHGGGITGFGEDELSGSDPLSPLDIMTAIALSEARFDIIGFDACMMASYEVAYSVAFYCKYMIASEEMEPVGGWNYRTWLTELAKNPGKDSAALCKMIVDAYMNWCKVHAPNIKTTLSAIDLDILAGNVPQRLSRFSKTMLNDLAKNEYDVVSVQKTLMSGLSKANQNDMVDMIEFASSMKNEQAKELEKALRSSVIYNRKYPESLKMNGILICIYGSTDLISGTNLNDLKTIRNLGVSESYMDYFLCIRKYMDIVNGKKERTLLDVFNNIDRNTTDSALYEAINETQLDVTDCCITEDENHIPQLTMPEEKKRLITYICQKIYGKIDGEEVHYGSFYFKPEDYPIQYSGFWKYMRENWLYFNDIMCPFYMEEKTETLDERTEIYGYTGMICNDVSGALFLRIVYDGSSDSASVEPICFQEMDFTKDFPYGRVIPMTEMNDEDVVCLGCYKSSEEEGHTLVRLTEDMKWKDAKGFAVDNPEINYDFHAAYYAVDLFRNFHELPFKETTAGN